MADTHVAGHSELVRGDDDSALLTRFITKHCASCHDTDTKQNGLDLTTLPRQFGDPKISRHWINALDQVKRGNMPPQDADQPTPENRIEFLTTLIGFCFGQVGRTRQKKVESASVGSIG